MVRAFARAFLPHLLGLMKKQHHLHARTKEGVTHETEWERLSGSAETSAFNTILNAFIHYLAFRMSSDAYGIQLTVEVSWSKLCTNVVVGGDDGLNAGIPEATMVKAARHMGQVVKFDTLHCPQPGVTFLARRYGPDVWTGELDSTCDLARQLSKFHLTVNLPGNVTAITKLQEKSFAFWLTDRNTPIIGDLVTKVFRLFPFRSADFVNVHRIYGVEMDAERQYPNGRRDWMQDLPRTELEGFDVDLFRSWLDGADRDSIFHPPLFAEPVPADSKSGVVSVDGDTTVSSTDDSDKRRPRQPRRALKPNGKAHFRPRTNNRARFFKGDGK